MKAVAPLALAAASLIVSACSAKPAPHPRALESNELCALAYSRGQLQTAEDQCDLCLQFSPDYADCWANKGIIAYARGQDAKAKEYLITALRKNPEIAQAYNNLGLLYMKEFAYGKAHDNFERALKVNPDYLEARYNLAGAWKALKEPERAKKELRTIIQIKGDIADAWGMLGQIALDESENEKAIEYFTKATQIDARYTAAWMALGNAYLEAGFPCDGKDAYSSCIELDEQNAACRNNIIVAQKKCTLQEKALEDVKAHAAGTRTAESEYAVALQAKDKGLTNDEERAYKRCLKYDPKFVRCHWGLFEIYQGRSDEKLARVACQNVLKFGTESEFPAQLQTCQKYVP
jgi:tetratricopeptide (TPR) repeat protein